MAALAALLTASGCTTASPSSAGASCDDPMIRWASRDRTAERLRFGLLEGDFAHVDQVMSCLDTSPRRFDGGETASSAVYLPFRLRRPDGGPPAEQATRAAAWWTQTRSPYAEFAGLRQRYDAAWMLRGSGFASTVAPTDFDAFHAQLRALEEGLAAVSPALRGLPMRDQLLLATVTDEPQPGRDAIVVFDESIARWPQNDDLRINWIDRLVPRWGGTWTQVERFADEQSRRVGEVEGGMLYATLYRAILRSGHRLQETRVDRARFVTSLGAWIVRYPTPENLNLAASAACAAEDEGLFTRIYGRLTDRQVTSGTWYHAAQQGICTALYIHHLTPPRVLPPPAASGRAT